MGLRRPFRRTIFNGNFALKDMSLGQKIGFESRGAFFFFCSTFSFETEWGSMNFERPNDMGPGKIGQLGIIH
jgi:hypothetical protein